MTNPGMRACVVEPWYKGGGHVRPWHMGGGVAEYAWPRYPVWPAKYVGVASLHIVFG